MRYVAQSDDFSCGPVAILNALKWVGSDATIKNYLPFLQFGCRTIDLEDPTNWDDNGTSNQDFDRILRYVGKGKFKIRRTHRPTVPMIRRHLMAGGSVALGYFWRDGTSFGEHFCFLSKMENNQFVTANDHLSTTYNAVCYRLEKTIRRWLKKSDDSPVAWFLTKESASLG